MTGAHRGRKKIFAAAITSAVMVGLLTLPMGTSAAGGERPEKFTCTHSGDLTTCLFGPLGIVHGRNTFTLDIEPPIFDGYVTSVRGILVNTDGDPIRGHQIHIHHMLIKDLLPDRTVLCENRKPNFYITGQERTLMRFPEGFGYQMPPSDVVSDDGDKEVWGLSGMLMSENWDPRKKIYIRFKMRTAPPEAQLTPMHNNWMSVYHGCESGDHWTIRQGEGDNGVYRKDFVFEMPSTARAVWGTGHMHDGGIKLVLRNLTTGERVLVSRALYGKKAGHHGHHSGSLKGTTNFRSATGVMMNQGDMVRLSVFYDDSKRRVDVMGNLRLGVVPE